MANEKNWEVIRVQMVFKIMAWKGSWYIKRMKSSSLRPECTWSEMKQEKKVRARMMQYLVSYGQLDKCFPTFVKWEISSFPSGILIPDNLHLNKEPPWPITLTGHSDGKNQSNTKLSGPGQLELNPQNLTSLRKEDIAL